MALDTYAGLQTAILSWLARPGDTLVEPAVPDMIRLFEREATRRLKVAGAEKRASLTALSSAVLLPADFGELRLATSGGINLTYVPPHQLPGGGGSPAHYTIVGNELHLGPGPDQTCTVEIIYQSGVPPLSDSNPTNWLLDQHPDCYLFGALTEAESYIGHDERVPLWAQRREATFASIEQHDRKQRWNGTPLSVRAEGVSYRGGGSAAGDWISAPPVVIPITAIVAGPGLIGGGTSGPVTLALDSPVAIGDGGTDAATAPQALANLGAAPLDSPVLVGSPEAPTPPPGDDSTALATTEYIQIELAGYAPLNSPTLTGDPKAPTPAPGDNDTSIATSAFVQAALAALPPSGSSITTSDTPPGSPADGDAWWCSLDGQLYIFFIDASGPPGQWIPASNTPGPVGATGAAGPAGSANMSGMTAGQIPVAATATSVTSSIPLPLTVAQGGTNSTTAAAALTALGAVPAAGGTMTGVFASNYDSGGVRPASSAGSGFALTNDFASNSAVNFWNTVERANTGIAFDFNQKLTSTTSAKLAEFLFDAGSANYTQYTIYGPGGARSYIGNSQTSAWIGSPNAVSLDICTSDVARLTISATGNATFSGAVSINSSTGDPLTIQTPSGQFARVQTTITGVRSWIAGTSTDGTYHIADNTTPAVRLKIDTAGACFNTSGTWSAISDASLKEEVQPYKRGLEAILELNPVQFRYQAGTPFAEPDKPSRVLYGLIAEEVAPHVPEIVGRTTANIKGTDTEVDTLEPGNLVYALINSVKTLASSVNELSAKVQALEAAK